MEKYFNIKFDFNKERLENTIENKSKNGKGYCCFVDLNSLTHSYYDLEFRKILNSALVNSCDGSYIARVASKIYKKKLEEYIGPDFFEKFIFKNGTHVILGSTQSVFNKIIKRISKKKIITDNIKYLNLPYCSVNKFDYKKISEEINNLRPNYIWVSLGAPKQEYFMSNLYPYIDKGVLIGVGAALNYFSGELKSIPYWVRKLNIIWVYRAIQEPTKTFPRIYKALTIFPKLIREERIRNK